MRRVRSKPYIDFSAWVEESRKPMQKAGEAHLAGDETWRYLVSSVIVLTHSKFEAFFAAVVHYIAGEINTRKLPAERLPGHIWGAMLNDMLPHKELKHFYVFQDERHYLNQLEKRLIHATPLDLSWHSKNYVGQVSLSVLMGGESNYPKFDRLNRVFHRISKLNFRAEISKRINADPELIIDEFGGLRAAIAHTGLPSGLTIPDVTQKIKRLCKLVKAIDDMVILDIVGKLPR